MRWRSLSESAEMGEAVGTFWAKAGTEWNTEKVETMIRKKSRRANMGIVFLINFASAERMHAPSFDFCRISFLLREIALLDFPAVRRLNGAGIVRIQSCKRCDLCRGKLHGSFQDEPLHIAARRDRERAVKGEVILIGRQQIRSVDHNFLELGFFAGFLRDVAPDVSNQGVLITALQQDGDGHGASICMHVDQMKNHVAFLAIVDHFHWCELVVEFDRLQIRRLRIFDVDGRLALAALAGCKARVQIAPMLRAVGAGVTQVRGPTGRMFLRESRSRASQSNGKKRGHAPYQNSAANFHRNFLRWIFALQKPPHEQETGNSIPLLSQIFNIVARKKAFPRNRRLRLIRRKL